MWILKLAPQLKKKGGLDYWGSVNNKQRPGKAEIEYKNTIRFEIW